MDMIKIKTALFRGIVAKALAIKITEVLGFEVNVDINDLEIDHDGKCALAKANVEVSTTHVNELVQKMGL